MTKPPSAQVRRSALWTGAVMCALLLSTGSTRADDDNGIKELVKSMSDYLAAQKSISFDMQSTLDVVTTEGQRLGIARGAALGMGLPKPEGTSHHDRERGTGFKLAQPG